mgnify:CR=1 FL=1
MQKRTVHNDILTQMMNIGEAMLTSGSSVNRVEEILKKMGRAYGAIHMNVFVITSCVIVTICFEDEIELTQTRRISGPGGSDFSKVEAYSRLCERCCRQPMAVEELAAEVETIRNKKYSVPLLYVGSALASGGFAVFFGGSLWDGLLAALIGMFICYFQKKLKGITPNYVVYLLLCAFASGLLITIMGKAAPFLHPDKIMIGDIMLLIPGIAMTNSVRDILVGDTISGLMRLIETIVWAGALACGFMIPMWLVSAGGGIW